MIVDDQPIFRAGLRKGLAAAADVELLADTDSGPAAAAKARSLDPDVVLLDIQTAGMNGLAVMAALIRAAPRARIIVLSALNDPETVREFLTAGAWGYALKFIDVRDIVASIAMVMKGSKIISTGIAASALQNAARLRTGPQDASLLSKREIQVLAGIAEGRKSKDLARKLHLSVRTVETHRYRIMRKLGIHSIAGLVRYAIVAGLIKPI